MTCIDGGNNARIITRDLSEYFVLKEGGDYSSDGKASAVFYFGNGVTKTFTVKVITTYERTFRISFYF